jgi:hypothetical protein
MFRLLISALTAPGRRWCTMAAVTSLVLSAYLPMQASLSAYCGALSAVPFGEWITVLAPLAPLKLLAGWCLMLVAMMTPLAADPLRHAWFASLPPRRGWAVLLCSGGYFAVWILMAPTIIVISWGLRTVGAWAMPVAIAAALAWSFSPWSQHARNRCHRLLRIGAHGFRANGECLGQGMYSGAMCVAVCWPWMLVPMVANGYAHVLSMIGVSLWLTVERILPPRAPGWRWPPVVAHALWRRRLRQSSLSSQA